MPDRTSIALGSVFGRLTVVGHSSRVSASNVKSYFCECSCQCGTTGRMVLESSLRTGYTKSCGCLQVEAAKKITHGHNRKTEPRTSEYNSWACMIARTRNPKNPRWKHYGGRGIRVCDRWNKFPEFIADMGPKPEPKRNYSIERIDVNGNYEPSNCRWATNDEQQVNRVGNHRITFYGKTMTISQWSAVSQISQKNISNRIAAGWSERAAVWAPVGARMKDIACLVIAFALLCQVSMRAGEPLFKPTGKYAPVITKPTKPAEQSDLHSHLCSKCNHEWWHDPTKGSVSHNCPKCGRQQYVINRNAPTGARSTPSPAASLQQVVRAPVSQKTVYVVGSTTCYPCRLFKQKHGDGDDKLKYVYCYMDNTRPADSEIDVATWNELVKLNNSGRFVYPFFVVKLEDGEVVGAQARVE